MASTGEDAAWHARETAYDVLLLDVMLSDVDGREVCRRLRADGIWTPVLMLTARSGRGTGLGLSIVQAVAVAHGGNAHATNLASGGADVWMSLPADQ